MSTRITACDLATVFEVGSLARASDAELLDRFRTERAEIAFRLLVERHGPMVLGVCRRIVGDGHAAEDAFQATFLILARKAGSVRVDDSLGPWLYGVAVRVARRARAVTARNGARHASLDGIDPPARMSDGDDAELRAVVDEAIARLPARQRSVVVLCLLEGMTQEQAAIRLRCAAGTVRSRLHRARERLRSTLVRRGFAPSLTGLVPAALTDSTLARLASGAAVSPAVATLVRYWTRSMFMSKALISLPALLGLIASGAVAFQASDGPEPKPKPAAANSAPAPAETKPTVADEFAAIKAEYDAKLKALEEAIAKIKDRAESSKTYSRMAPDESAFSRRMVEAALKSPGDAAARDALIWVIHKPFMSDDQKYGYTDEFGRAAALLVRHHGDDPIAISAGFGLDNVPSIRRDAMLHGFLASAKSRESKGLARAALARYLERKEGFVRAIRKEKGPLVTRYQMADRVVEEPMLPEKAAYWLMLAESDPEYIRNEAIRLYEEMIRDYSDVPFQSAARRELARRAGDPKTVFRSRPLTDEERATMRKRADDGKTLGDLARERLDDMFNLAIGKPAPEIEGVDLEGKPLKLSDHRGKAVLLVFWATWCGPCVADVPKEKALVERLKGKPFVLLGVNADRKPETAREFVAKEKVSWSSWFDGRDDLKIANRYHVPVFPTAYLIDAGGIIRDKGSLGDHMMREIDKLLADPAAPAPKK